MKKMRLCIALVALAVGGGAWVSAQVPETLYHSDATAYNAPLWRAFVDVMNGQDENALVNQTDLSTLLEEFDGDCFSSQYDVHGYETVLEGVDVRSSLESAAMRADFAASVEVLSVIPGVFRTGNFGSILELAITENFSSRPFPRLVKDSETGKRFEPTSTIYYFYPAWKFEYKGTWLCGADQSVPQTIPEEGDSMIVFALENDIGDAPWFFGSAAIFPVLQESKASGRLSTTTWTEPRSALDIAGEMPSSLADAAKRLRTAMKKGGAR